MGCEYNDDGKMNMNSLNSNNTSDSLQNEVKRHGLASTAIGATADSEKKEGDRDAVRTSARAGARRKVLPPITVCLAQCMRKCNFPINLCISLAILSVMLAVLHIYHILLPLY